MAGLASPPILHIVENITLPEALRDLRAFYAPGGDGGRFRVHLDDACGLPSNWRETWSKPLQWGLTGNKNWATKYAAAGFIPRMIDVSPFVTTDWRSASASVVVLFARQYAAGPAIAQQQCLQRLHERSPAFRATNGSRHFFIFTDSRGPCCLDGKYKDVGFLNHHVIGPHGEPHDEWFFRRGKGPRIRCFDPRKDVNIPTPNIHFPRTPYAPALTAPPLPSAASPRSLLLFYAGWNYGVRMELVGIYKDDAEVHVRQAVPPDEYVRRILSAKFCPVCGGFSQWTPRLAEALYYECVPIILSPMMLPPWSQLLDWSQFSVRMEPTRANLLGLKAHLKTLDHAKLLAGVRAAKHALTYRLDKYEGDDMLPLLLYEMSRVASVPIAPPPLLSVRQLSNDIATDRDYDVGLRNVQSQRAHDVSAAAVVELNHSDTGRSERWSCSTRDGYMCACRKQPAAASGSGTGRGGGGRRGGRVGRVGRRGKGGGAGDFYTSLGAGQAASGGSGTSVSPGVRLAASAGVVGDDGTDRPAGGCPAEADLEDPRQLDAMLAARASARRDVVITILGPTSGTRAIRMEEEMGEAFVLNLLHTLEGVGVMNTLPITTHLKNPAHPGNNLCLQRLRKRGVCCAYSGVGMDLVRSGAPGRAWTVEETHPYMLFLQRWWLTGQAVWRGYNVLSLDTDLHLAANPLAMLRAPAYAGFDAIMQLDSAWAVQGHAEGQAPTDERGQHVNVVPCRRALLAPSAAADAHGCVCGAVPAPLLNTGFVYVRAAAGAAATSLPQLIYNRSVAKILHRLARTPNHDAKDAVDPHAVWAQDVVNEVASEMASLHPGVSAAGRRCHKRDTACLPRPLSAQDARDAKRRWWLPKLSHSVWLAAHRRTAAAETCDAALPRGTPNDLQLVAWTSLVTPAAAASTRTDGAALPGGGGYGGGDAAGALPFPAVSTVTSGLTGVAAAPTLAALPRVAVGRMCGARLPVSPSWLTRARPVPCEASSADLGRSILGQDVLHMQFTHAETRKSILQALHWWRAPPSPGGATAADADAPGSSGGSQLTTCDALAAGTSPAAASSRLSAIIVSSALASTTLLCLVPGHVDGQSVHIKADGCPCCWKVEELQRGIAAGGAAADEASSAAEAKALSKARRYTGCRIWRRHA